MSGFDFGSLRDPDAPQPDARHREGVETRARELRRSASRQRMLVSGLALVVVIAAVAGIIATRPNSGGSLSVTGRGSTTTAPAPSSVGDRFVPPTTIEHGLVVLPVTFPSGETTTLRYPPAMKIAQLGFAGGAAVATAPHQCCSQEVGIRYTTVARVYGDAQPVKTYRGPNGEAVPYFHASQARDPINASGQDYLAFQFGPWLVQVSDVSVPGQFNVRMTDAQRATWARSLTGTVDTNGFLVLHAQAPLSVTNAFEGGFGSDPSNFVELDPHLYCDGPGSDTAAHRQVSNADGSHGVSWCVGKDLHVSASGSASFAELAASKLEVGPLLPASAPLTSVPTTTTTTTPAPASSPAVSATFVSPQHGWVLQRNGNVAETTDGGMNWKTLGSVGPLGLAESHSFPQIRFADAARGFVRTDRDLFTTDDGGAHWAPLQVPFASALDLAISRGVVYAVALPMHNVGKFEIWSSPANRPVWSRDPLTLQIGAGPIPSDQIVFAGGQGWILNEDRTVLPSARLSSTGHWVRWKPPCLDVNGPAYLTASTSNDLVATCGEGVWGGGPIASAVYFSHDGGHTFQRRTAPAFGEVASPNPTTAVIDTNGVLRRTTDEGASWSEVAREPNAYHARDLGFTTATQGFVIFSDGKMLMTYDAGATWSAATLP